MSNKSSSNHKSITPNPICIFPVMLSTYNSLSLIVPLQVFPEQNNEPPASLTEAFPTHYLLHLLYLSLKWETYYQKLQLLYRLQQVPNTPHS